MRNYTRTFQMDSVKSSFIQELQTLCDRFDAMEVRYSMIMSDSNLATDAGKWLWDPKNQNIVAWAAPKDLMNGAGYLTVNGHRELAKSLIVSLTNQL